MNIVDYSLYLLMCCNWSSIKCRGSVTIYQILYTSQLFCDIPYCVSLFYCFIFLDHWNVLVMTTQMKKKKTPNRNPKTYAITWLRHWWSSRMLQLSLSMAFKGLFLCLPSFQAALLSRSSVTEYEARKLEYSLTSSSSFV